MKVKFSAEQSQWLQSVTGTENLQDAVDFFLDCMKKEGIAAADILDLIDLMMQRKMLPPGKK